MAIDQMSCNLQVVLMGSSYGQYTNKNKNRLGYGIKEVQLVPFNFMHKFIDGKVANDRCPQGLDGRLVTVHIYQAFYHLRCINSEQN